MLVKQDVTKQELSFGIVYYIEKLETGESVFAQGTKAELFKAQKDAHGYGYVTNKKFKTRSMDGGVRIWRTQ
jgi:hypothetical protein